MFCKTLGFMESPRGWARGRGCGQGQWEVGREGRVRLHKVQPTGFQVSLPASTALPPLLALGCCVRFPLKKGFYDLKHKTLKTVGTHSITGKGPECGKGLALKHCPQGKISS